MITLSQASFDTKEILKWGGIFITGLVIILSSFLFIKNTFFPTPPPKPTVGFGKLAPQLFPQNIIEKKLTYTINTLSGALPEFPNQNKVFKMQANTPDLLGLSNSQTTAHIAGFTQGPNKISDVLYQWENPLSGTLSSKVNIDIVNYNFNISSDYVNNYDILSGQGLKQPDQCISDAQNMLSKLNSLPSDIDPSKTQTAFLSIQNGTLVTTTSLSSAQAVRVIFYQKDVNKLPIYYENPNASNIDVLVGPEDKILEADYIHQTVTNQFETYPMKSSAQAFGDLRQGYAYIASYQGNTLNISINNVILAYYIGTKPQDYLMPIFVFEGNNNFVAYVPAVTDGWINK